jgi:hypothetical protein
LSAKVVDITSKKDVPLAKKAKWVTYLPNPALEYATRFTVNGKYIIRLQEKNVYVELCPDEMMGKDCNVPAMSKKEARILKKMKLREATKATIYAQDISRRLFKNVEYSLCIGLQLYFTDYITIKA